MTRNYVFTSTLGRITITACLAAILFITGCDRQDPLDAWVEGRVTDNPGYGKTTSNIEGAVVTASRVTAGGQVHALSGQATTNAEGRYSLETDLTNEVVLLQAETANFQSRAVIEGGLQGGTTTQAPPMTTESTVEADVYVAARASGETSAGHSDAVSTADVSVLVNQNLAARVEAGGTATAQIVPAVKAYASARNAYLRSEAGGTTTGAQLESAIQAEQQARVQLQTSLHAAADADAEAAAVRAFEEALVQAHTAANIQVRNQAKARQTATGAAFLFTLTAPSDVQHEIRKQATILAAIATGRAVEAEFSAQAAPDARIETLAAARAALITQLRAAASSSAIDAALEVYRNVVFTELQAQTNLSAAAIDASQSALGLVRLALLASMGAAGSINGVVSAFTTFYDTAQTTALNALPSSDANAVFAAEIVVLINLTSTSI